MKNRIKEIRTAVGKSQVDFAKQISVSRSAVCKMESGENLPSDQTIHLICKEFNVNEKWLRNGTGEMFVEMSRDEELAEFFGTIQCSDDDSFPKQFMEVLKELDVDEWEVLAKMALKLANKMKKD